MQSARLQHLTPEEYLAWENAQPDRHEYVDGEVYAMSGASRRHNTIVTNVVVALGPRVNEKGCELFSQGMKLRADTLRAKAFFYPDIVISCDASADDEYFLNRPCLVIEVLSPSTAAVDQREKRRHYLAMPTLREYLIVDQDRHHIEVYRRDGEGWLAETLSAGDPVRLDCIDVTLDFTTIYRNAPPLVLR
jgi:Uma2 family endonuclease